MWAMTHENNIEVIPQKEVLAKWLDQATFEITPTDKLLKTIDGIPALGNKFDVTCSPTKPIEQTIDFSVELAKTGVEVHTHLAARKIRDDKHLAVLCNGLLKKGIDRLFVIAGDSSQPEGVYSSALDLLNSIWKMQLPFVQIGVGCYPEGHSFIGDGELDEALYLKQKFADNTGLNMYAVSQMCFEKAPIESWLVDKRRKTNFKMPYHAGVVAPMNYVTLLKHAKRCGVKDTTNFIKNVSTALRLGQKAVFGYKPDQLLVDLSENALPSEILIYTFNEIEATKLWFKDFKSLVSNTK